jgi:hypothetical protein
VRLLGGGQAVSSAAAAKPDVLLKPDTTDSSYLTFYRGVFGALRVTAPISPHPPTDCLRVLEIIDTAYLSAARQSHAARAGRGGRQAGDCGRRGVIQLGVCLAALSGRSLAAASEYRQATFGCTSSTCPRTAGSAWSTRRWSRATPRATSWPRGCAARACRWLL